MKRSVSTESLNLNVKRVAAPKLEPGTSRDLNNNDVINIPDENTASLSHLKSLFPYIEEKRIKAIFNYFKSMGRSNSNCLELATEHILNTAASPDSKAIPIRSREPVVQQPQRSFESDLKEVMSIIPDCAPDFIEAELKKCIDNPNRVSIVVSALVLEKKPYPKLKDYLNKKKLEQENENLLKFDIVEFCKMYEDPSKYFNDTTAQMSQSYIQHCQIELKNKCPYLSEESITKALKDSNNHLLPAYKELEVAYCNQERSLLMRIQDHIGNMMMFGHVPPELQNQILMEFRKITFQKKYKKYKLNNLRRAAEPYPRNLDRRFFHELMYIKNETEIKKYMNEQVKLKEKRLLQAKITKTNVECQCCFEDELIKEDMLACPQGHQFCKNCIKRNAETIIGDSKYVFKCIEATCESEYSLETLKEVLTSNQYSHMIVKKQNEEVRQANLSGLESCPYCTYSVIIDNPNEKIFTCLNPSCMKETCRKCHEENHLPLRCDEVNKIDDFRTFIENKVTEAMLRTCWKCSKRFYKTEGCNMMHCVCGAAMCYICQKPIKNYDHFREEGSKCAMHTDVAKLHKLEMQKALVEAKAKYLADNPNAADIDTRFFDPSKLIEAAPEAKQPVTRQ